MSETSQNDKLTLMMAFIPAHGILEAMGGAYEARFRQKLSVFLPLRVSILEKLYHHVKVAITSGSFLKSFLGIFGTDDSSSEFSASTV